MGRLLVTACKTFQPGSIIWLYVQILFVRAWRRENGLLFAGAINYGKEKGHEKNRH